MSSTKRPWRVVQQDTSVWIKDANDICVCCNIPRETADLIVESVNSHDCLVEENKRLREACEAALKYDKAIYQCANDPEKMSSFCSAQGETLDKLYFDWISKARQALKQSEEK